MRSSTQLGQFLTGAREQLPGRISTEEKDRDRCSRDQSIYRVLPAAVARPRDPEELLRLVRLAAEARVSITVRGGGSGTGGAALTDSVLVLLKGPYWEAAPEILQEGTEVRVRPGVSYADLAGLLTPLGRTIPADPSSGAISTLGGNIATRASGPHAYRHGSMDRYLRDLTVVDGTGALINTGDPLPPGMATGLEELRTQLSPALLDRIRHHDTFKSASGPRLSPFVRDPSSRESATSLFCGSLGTFGLVTEAVLQTHPLPERRQVVLHAAGSDQEALELTETLRGPETFAVELIDALALRIAGRSKLMDGQFLTAGQRRILARPGTHLLVHETSRPEVPPLTKEQAERFWKLRKAMLWQVGRFNPRFPAYSLINDLSVPRDRLQELITGLRRIAADLAIPLPFYGHAGDGNLHFRPLFRKDAPDLRARMHSLAEEAYSLVASLGGSVTGEHGLGRLRAPFLELEWGGEGAKLFGKLKTIFDPQEILNPGSMLPRHELLEDFEAV